MNRDELAVRFTYHPPQGDQPARFVALRDGARTLAELIASSTPECREQSLAISAVEEAVFWANAAIARREPRP